jgi:hypothetical protein
MMREGAMEVKVVVESQVGPMSGSWVFFSGRASSTLGTFLRSFRWGHVR